MSGNGKATHCWGLALQGPAPPMLQAALRTVTRSESTPAALPECNGETCRWVRAVADCLARGECRRAVLFCDEAAVACCVANKVPGVRAVATHSLDEALQAVTGLGANLLIAEPRGRTFFEFKQLLQLCCGGTDCPPGVACVLQELDGHAHR
jgi:hypothetical protein